MENQDRPVVVRRVVDVNELNKPEILEEKPITATRVAVISHIKDQEGKDTVLLIPLDLTFPSIEGDRVRENGLGIDQAKVTVIALFGKDASLSDDVWSKAIAAALAGSKVVLGLSSIQLTTEGKRCIVVEST